MMLPSNFESSTVMHFYVIYSACELLCDDFHLYVMYNVLHAVSSLSVGMMMIRFLVGIRRDMPGRPS